MFSNLVTSMTSYVIIIVCFTGQFTVNLRNNFFASASKNVGGHHWTLGDVSVDVVNRLNRRPVRELSQKLSQGSNKIDTLSALSLLNINSSTSSEPVDCLGCQCKSCYDGHCAQLVKCENGGRLENQDSGAFRFICECSRYFRGQCCQKKLCMGGSVLGDDGVCQCKHPSLQSGEHCEHAFCVNGGTSHEGTCRHCPWPWNGPFCERLMCYNGGLWERTDNGTQSCRCPSGFAGRICDVDLTVERRDGSASSKSTCVMAVISDSTCDHFDTTWVALLVLMVVMLTALALFGYQNWLKTQRRRHLSDWIYAQPPQPVLIPQRAGPNNGSGTNNGGFGTSLINNNNNGGNMTRNNNYPLNGIGGTMATSAPGGQSNFV